MLLLGNCELGSEDLSTLGGTNISHSPLGDSLELRASSEKLGWSESSQVGELVQSLACIR